MNLWHTGLPMSLVAELQVPTIYTIGHSTHSLEVFTSMLQKHGITCLVDVRSVAASAYNPQYNQEVLSAHLKGHGILYLHFADEFGARHADAALLNSQGKVDFEKVRNSWAFNNGVERLWKGIHKGHRIVLMCSESNPMDCHRFSMVSCALVADGLQVMHILKDSSLMTNEALEQELLKQFEKKLPQPDLFNPTVTKEHQLKVAYSLVNDRIGFSPTKPQEVTDFYD